MIGDPYVPPNPWTWAANDVNGRTLAVTVNWRSNTKALSGAVITRAVGCQLTTLYIGVGADGTPNSSPNAYAVPEGTTNIGSGQLKANGLSTIDDVTALQITAG